MKIQEIKILYSVIGGIYILIFQQLCFTFFLLFLSVYLYEKTIDISPKKCSKEKKEFFYKINTSFLIPFLFGTIVTFSLNWFPYLFYLTAFFSLWFPFEERQFEEIFYSFFFFYFYFIIFAPLLFFPFLS